MREIVLVVDPERKLFIYSAFIILAVFVGPFGTYEYLSVWQRIVFWSLDIIGAFLMMVPILHIFYGSRLTAAIPPWPRFLLGVFLGAIPAGCYILLLYKQVSGGGGLSIPFPSLVAQITVVSTLLFLIEFTVWPRLVGHGHPAADTDAPQGQVGPEADAPALLERLPSEHRGAQVMSISMQDHYAEITTTAGTALVLMRLNDAITLLGETPGLRVHRSHWVAREFAERLQKDGRRHKVILSDGRALPVSTANLAAARALFATAP